MPVPEAVHVGGKQHYNTRTLLSSGWEECRQSCFLCKNMPFVRNESMVQEVLIFTEKYRQIINHMVFRHFRKIAKSDC